MIDRDKFEHRYRQLLYVTHEKGSEPDFRSGLWNEEEGYKRDVWKNARAALQLQSWPEHQNDPKYICDRAIDAIDQCGNLLATPNSQFAWREDEGTYEKAIVTILENKEKVAAALLGLFSTENLDNDGLYFDQLASVLRKIYDGFSFIAYFFFLKNQDEYAPVRRKRMTQHLKLLGADVSIMDTCNWENYRKYLVDLKEIKGYLNEKGHEATLLDAQSFLWMLWMIKPETPEYGEREFRDYSNGIVHISKEQWVDLINNGTLTENDIKYLAKFYSAPNHASTLIRLAEIEGKHHSSYITPCVSIGQKVADLLSIPSIPREGNPDTEKFYPIVFLGRRLRDGHFEWKLRPELAEALEETCGQALADEIENREELEEQEAERLPLDELMARANAYHGGASAVYTSNTKQRKRNGLLVIAAKIRAGGACQLCGKTPFVDRDGKPYLEAHHIVPLAEDGPDELSNMVALCPNCHRKMHVVGDTDDVAKLMALAEF